ncbi:phage tail protein [Shigella sonnei]|nr:phage tail protein [Escherichia coli]EFX1701621.1 phage tail protein [Shigella sonnei]EEZ5551888.1 phage tail protein [Escherichia coli]EFX1719084.1 phage tail protein [Shigella sonnei]EFX2368306.1 phage tail protein [Shigella sonnei]
MLTVDNDNITLLLAGKAYSHWQRYRIDSDFLKPADGWQLGLGLPSGTFPADAVRGAPVKVMAGDDVILSGRIDSVQREVSRRGLVLSLSGRDNAAVLVDCAAPIYNARQLNLDEAISAIVSPLGIKRVRIQASSVTRNDMIHIEPGERAWDALVRVASARGLWPWCDPDGTLVIGGPDYTKAPVATLQLSRDENKTNVLSLVDNRNISGCYSELTMLAQSHATLADSQPVVIDVTAPHSDTESADTLSSGETGRYNRSHTEKDPTVQWYRPQILVVGDVDNAEQLAYRARKAMADARLSGLDITIEVAGHRTASGELWTPGQRIHVISELHGIDDVFFLMGRSLNGGRPSGKTTILRLKEDGVWLPDAYPTDKKASRRKKKKPELVVLPVWEKN